MHKRLVILSILFFAISCSPLKKVQRSEDRKQTIIDNSISELVKTEIEKQISSINQTVVEFYEPKTVYSVDTLPTLYSKTDKSGQKSKKSVDSVDSIDTVYTVNTKLKPKKPPNLVVNQPVKRITTTEIRTQNDKTTQTDSITVSDIVDSIDTVHTEKIDENPSNFIIAIKWIAICLGVILLIIIIIKIW